MFKRLYTILALIAMVNLFALGGFAAFLFGTGRLDAERVEQVAMVLRGEFPADEAESVTSRPVEADQTGQRTRDEIARREAERKFYELVSDRRQRELKDRNSLNQRIQFEVNRQLETIEEEQEQFTEQRRQVREELQQDGFNQALEMYMEMDPKLAKDVLITKKDADVVQFLVAMDSFKRKKIFSACKTPEEKSWIARVLAQVQLLDEEAANPATDGDRLSG